MQILAFCKFVKKRIESRELDTTPRKSILDCKSSLLLPTLLGTKHFVEERREKGLQIENSGRVVETVKRKEEEKKQKTLSERCSVFVSKCTREFPSVTVV